MPRSCKNKTDSFCYICGDVTFKKQKRPLNPLVCLAYELYFDCKVGDQDKAWAPKICCKGCYTSLTGWIRGEKRSMRFAVPMVLLEPTSCGEDCYFCMTKIVGISENSRHTVKYPKIPSAIRPEKHNDQLPVPDLPKNFVLEEALQTVKNIHSKQNYTDKIDNLRGGGGSL